MHHQLRNDAHIFLTDLLGQEIAGFYSRQQISYDEYAVCIQSFRPNGSVTTPIYLGIGAIPTFLDRVTTLDEPTGEKADEVWSEGDEPDSAIILHPGDERTSAQLSDKGRPSDGFRYCAVCGTLVNGDSFVELVHRYDRYDGNACIHMRCTDDLADVLENVYEHTDDILADAL